VIDMVQADLKRPVDVQKIPAFIDASAKQEREQD
jgi:hypothetical protein